MTDADDELEGEAGSDCSETAEQLIGRKQPKRRIDIGEKMKCPKCGSDHVRAMSRAEMEEYLGGNRFVLTVPRKCKVCGHEYKAIPSKAGYAVLFFAVLATLGLVAWCALLSGLPLFAIFGIIAGCLVLILLLWLLNKIAPEAPLPAWRERIVSWGDWLASSLGVVMLAKETPPTTMGVVWTLAGAGLLIGGMAAVAIVSIAGWRRWLALVFMGLGTFLAAERLEDAFIRWLVVVIGGLATAGIGLTIALRRQGRWGGKGARNR
jgi:uncharacterized protein (DUF983 family)